MTDKGLNYVDKCAAKYVHLPSQEKKCTSSPLGKSKMYTPSAIATLQRASIEVNKNSVFAKVRTLVEQVIL